MNVGQIILLEYTKIIVRKWHFVRGVGWKAIVSKNINEMQHLKTYLINMLIRKNNYAEKNNLKKIFRT